jgi:hypothetical protein
VKVSLLIGKMAILISERGTLKKPSNSDLLVGPISATLLLFVETQPNNSNIKNIKIRCLYISTPFPDFFRTAS